MKYIFKYGFFIALLSLNIPASAKVVHSLDQIPAQIHNEDGKSVFAQEMNGDGFGSGFWSTGTTLKPSDIIKIIAPQDINDRWSLVGMKAWPGQKDRYIVVACSTKATSDDNTTDQPNSCENPKNKIIVAVLDYDGSGLPTLAAKPYIEKMMTSDIIGRVENIKGDTFAKSAFYLKNNDDDIVVGNLLRLDFAHYQLNSQILAFGIRLGVSTGYSGGYVSDQSMTLFAIIEGKVCPVLKVNTYHFENIAGEWHEDGTRDHDISEKEYVLSILPHQTNGFSDIKRTQKGARNKKGKIYRWDSQKLSYQ